MVPVLRVLVQRWSGGAKQARSIGPRVEGGLTRS
jgi:hypothetical protein